MQLFDAAKECGADAVKLQKRDNRALYTRDVLRPALRQREQLRRDLRRASRGARARRPPSIGDCRPTHVSSASTFFATAFDFDERRPAGGARRAGVQVRVGRPPQHAAAEPRRGVRQADDPLHRRRGRSRTSSGRSTRSCLSTSSSASCSAPPAYPADTDDLNLSVITTLRERFPELVIGLSDHQNGIAMALAAYMLGARVIEKHFTLNHAAKGTDHAFSLMPEGMRKLVRDLQRIPARSATGSSVRCEIEQKPIQKMAKKLVAARELEQGHVITSETSRSSHPRTAACLRTSSTGSSGSGCAVRCGPTRTSSSSISSPPQSRSRRTPPSGRDRSEAVARAGPPRGLRLRRCLHGQSRLGERTWRGGARLLAQRRARLRRLDEVGVRYLIVSMEQNPIVGARGRSCRSTASRGSTTSSPWCESASPRPGSRSRTRPSSGTTSTTPTVSVPSAARSCPQTRGPRSSPSRAGC